MVINSKGFTLVELSIVIVIIGLVIGGVITGQSLIRAAEINSITSDIEKFKTSIYTFKTKYNALPGDMNNATAFWGAAADCTDEQTTAATCNGNGDGYVTSNPSASVTSGYEDFLMWKHLANAGLIQGNYIGITDGATYYSVTSRNSPSGKISGSLWQVGYSGVQLASGWGAFDGVYNQLIEFGMYMPDDSPYNNILTAGESYALDSKFDDGKPGTGKLRVLSGGFSNCTVKPDGNPTATSDADIAVYNVSLAGKECILMFPQAF